jgi:peptidoglycan/LPS O-acetylase OafA/YrhL
MYRSVLAINISIESHCMTFQDKGNISTLTGLRGIAALWVVLFHTCFGEPNGYMPGFHEKVYWGWGRNVIVQGVYAVDIFFVLSGFILTYVHRHEFENKFSLYRVINFLVLRLARIYPLHVFVVCLLLVAYWIGVWDQKAISYWDVIRNITLTNMWVDPSINTPAWSVSAELIAYLCFPIIIKMLLPLKKREFQFLIIFFLATIYPLCIMNYHWQWEWHYGWVAVARALNGFILGCLIFYAQEHFDMLKDSLRSSQCCLAISLIFLFFLVLGFPIIFLYPLIPFFIVTLANSQMGIAKIFANRVIVFLGTISFGIYMVHYPMLELIRYVFNDYYAGLNPEFNQLILWVHLCGILISVVGISALCYFWIEKPCREYFKCKWCIERKPSHQLMPQSANV